MRELEIAVRHASRGVRVDSGAPRKDMASTGSARCVRSVESLRDVAPERLLVTRQIALVDGGDPSRSTDQDRYRRRSLRVVEVRDVRVLVDDERELELVASREARHVRDGLGAVDGDGEHDEALVLLRFVQAAQVGQLRDARLAPCRPEVQENDVLPAKLRERDAVPVEVECAEIGRDRAGIDDARRRGLLPALGSRTRAPRAAHGDDENERGDEHGASAGETLVQ